MADEVVLSYASGLPTDPPVKVMREGDLLLVWRGAKLPGRCVFCNGEAAGRMKVKYSSSSTDSFKLRQAEHVSGCYEAGLCAGHLRRRRWKISLAVGCLLAGIGGMVMSAGWLHSSSNGTGPTMPLLAGFGGFAVMAAVGLMWYLESAGPLRVKRVTKGWVYLAGASKEFLETLPEMGA